MSGSHSASASYFVSWVILPRFWPNLSHRDHVEEGFGVILVLDRSLGPPCLRRLGAWILSFFDMSLTESVSNPYLGSAAPALSI